MREKERIMHDLQRIGAVKFGKFILSSGEETNFYFDLRAVISFPRVYSCVIDKYIQMIKKFGLNNFDFVAGVATSGLLFSSPVALSLSKPMIYVREKAKEHGLQKKIEGQLREESKVIIIDDVSTTGNTILNSAQVIRENGARVVASFVFIDRGKDSSTKLAACGIEHNCFFKAEELTGFIPKRESGMGYSNNLTQVSN